MATNRGERRRRPKVHVAELLRRSNEDDNRRSSSPASATAQYRSGDRVVPGILSRKRQAAGMQHGVLVARGAAAGLCLAALAVLAADTRKGWALDSYGNYSQFRYSEAMNVIGFVYSVLQFAALIGLMRSGSDESLLYFPSVISSTSP